MRTWPPRLLLAGLAVLGLGWWWWRQAAPVQVAVDFPLANGGALDPTAQYTADLYLDDHPSSRIRLVPLFNQADPFSAVRNIRELKRRGVRFFLSTQPSSHAVPSLPEFRTGDALAIGTGAASNALSGHNDFFFRIVPDVRQEQAAIAAALQRLPGKRVLVLQDTGNLAYTEPALASFKAALGGQTRWQLLVRPLQVSGFDARRDQALMQDNVDALYILAGSFQPAIGNISQLFHQLHPGAPILLTPWARSAAILANAGPASASMLFSSAVPIRGEDPAVDRYIQRFRQRFGYSPNGMAIVNRQAIELLDQALSSGARSPGEVKRYLLSRPVHHTSLGPIRFDPSGDVQARFRVFPATAERAAP